MPAGLVNPATLNLSGWWKPDFSASPWTGQSSAGASGGRDLTEATNPPAQSAALNGLKGADFDGTNDTLANATGFNTFMPAAGGSIVLWFNADTATVGPISTQPYAAHGMVIDATNGFTSLGYSTNGVMFGGYNGSNWDSVIRAAATGTPHFLCAKWNGATIYLDVDSTAQLSQARALTGGTTALTLGKNYNSTVWFDGKIYEVLLFPYCISDSLKNDLKYYGNKKFNLSL